MSNLLKLLGGFFVGMIRSRVAREARIAVCTRQAQIARRRSLFGSTGCFLRCSKLRSSSSPTRCCVDIGAASALEVASSIPAEVRDLVWTISRWDEVSHYLIRDVTRRTAQRSRADYEPSVFATGR
jgi:hypothetical protein